jgi:hypothetical protein
MPHYVFSIQSIPIPSSFSFDLAPGSADFPPTIQTLFDYREGCDSTNNDFQPLEKAFS